MNDYKMEIHRSFKVEKKGTRCYDLEKVLTVGRRLFTKDKHITKIVFTQMKKNNRITLVKRMKRTKYFDTKINTQVR